MKKELVEKRETKGKMVMLDHVVIMVTLDHLEKTVLMD